MRKLASLWLAVAALVASPERASAQDQARTLAVPATSSWQHAATGMILPPKAAGLTRGPIIDRTAAERDVSTEYSDEGSTVIATVYLYRTLLPDASLWFDRAVAAIFLQPRFDLGDAAQPVPTAFARPGAAAAGGLRATIPLAASGFTATAVALAPLGDWLVKVRMSSTRLDPGALDAQLTRFVEGLRWPAETVAARAASPIRPCPSPLSLKRAKRVRENMSDALVNALSGDVMAEIAGQDGTPAPPPTYCREGSGAGQYGVYRPDAARDRYVIALGDAGIALSAAPSLGLVALMSGSTRGGKQFGLTLLERDSRAMLPSFNRLPPPEQALEVLQTTAPTLSVSSGKSGGR